MWLQTAERVTISTRAGEIVGLPFQPGPPRIVLDAAGSWSSAACVAGYQSQGTAPHLIVAPRERRVVQLLPLDSSAKPMMTGPGHPYRAGRQWWVAVAKPRGAHLCDDDAIWVGEFLAGLVELTTELEGGPVPLEWPEKWGAAGLHDASAVPGTLGLGLGSFCETRLLAGLHGIDLGEAETWVAAELEPAAEPATTEEPEPIAVPTTAVPAVISEPRLESGPEPGESREADADAEPAGPLGPWPTRAREATVGSAGKAVEAFREALELGDGPYDAELEAMVSEWQERLGLPVTGTLDPDTWAAIDAALAAEGDA